MAGEESTAAGEDAKKRGNDAFGRGDFAEAVGQYTEAIMQNSSNPVFYLNRSMAYMKLHKYIDAERDASATLKLDGKSVKAFYRRASARKQLSKWQEARDDFEKVLVLDPNNKDAKAEVSAILQKSSEEEEQQKKKARRREPLDLRDNGLKEKSISPSTEPQAKVSSNVEAARRFLEQVQVTDQSSAPKSKGDGDKASWKEQKINVADRLPGESGAFLREVSTRRIDKDKSTSGFEKKMPTSSVSPRAGVIPERSEDRVEEKRRQPEQISTSLIVNSGEQSGPVQQGNARLSAYEFNRRLRQCSSEAEGSARYAGQLALLLSLDLQHFTAMIGSLLEPELLAELLIILSHAGTDSTQLVVDLMSVLPLCDRFETAWMFLNNAEKNTAKNLFTQLRTRQGVDLGSLKTLWKGKLER